MKCPKCQHINDVVAKFCAECASPLAGTCLHCGHQLLATAKFCSECGQPLGLHTYLSGGPGNGVVSHCPEPQASVAEQPTPQPLRDLIPAEVWARYDEAVDKAHSVGAFKQLKSIQQEIGFRFIELALKSGAGR